MEAPPRAPLPAAGASLPTPGGKGTVKSTRRAAFRFRRPPQSFELNEAFSPKRYRNPRSHQSSNAKSRI